MFCISIDSIFSPDSEIVHILTNHGSFKVKKAKIQSISSRKSTHFSRVHQIHHICTSKDSIFSADFKNVHIVTNQKLFKVKKDITWSRIDKFRYSVLNTPYMRIKSLKTTKTKNFCFHRNQHKKVPVCSEIYRNWCHNSREIVNVLFLEH